MRNTEEDSSLSNLRSMSSIHLRKRLRSKYCRKFNRVMLPTAVKPFIEKYFNYMTEERKSLSVSMEMQRNIRSSITNLAEYVDEEESKMSKSDENGSNHSSPLSSASSGSRVSDLGFDELNLDDVKDLQGAKKLEFLMTVRRDFEELATSSLINLSLRKQYAEQLCKASNIPGDIYISWISPPL